MEFLELVRSRRSVRAFESRPVEAEKLETILEAARLAPTAKNLQDFRVLVIPTSKHKEELRAIYGRDWLFEAPLLLLVCSVPGEAWVRSDGKSYADVDAAIVMDHIILAATSLGLGTCWVGAFKASAAREVLGLDPAWEPVVFTPLGYARETPQQLPRKGLDELVIRK